MVAGNWKNQMPSSKMAAIGPFSLGLVNFSYFSLAAAARLLLCWSAAAGRASPPRLCSLKFSSTNLVSAFRSSPLLSCSSPVAVPSPPLLLSGSAGVSYGSISGNPEVLGMPAEDIAATRIQTAFRAFMARKTLRCLKGMVRLQKMTQGHSVRKQASTTLSYLSSWSRIQTQIRARRLCMVTEGLIRQKKLENKLKLEAKLHDLEVEWCGGPEAMEEILARVYQREEASVKRERAMAYAFSHQWRANSSQNQGPGKCGFSNANWGWSWKERWIAARPWENRVHISPKKAQSRQKNKVGKNIISPTAKAAITVKHNGKGTTKARRLSYPSAEKPVARDGNIKPEEVNAEEEQPLS